MKRFGNIFSAACLALMLVGCRREDISSRGEAVLFAPYVPSAVATKGADVYEPVSPAYSLTEEMYGEGEMLLGKTPLYWPDNVNKYAFKAYAGTETLEADQSTEAKWLLQDRLEGFAYVRGVAGYTEDALNYRSAKQWYADNKSLGLPPEGETNEYYKKVPLYLKHMRSLITIKLKAGEGVKQEDLLNLDNIETFIHNYGGDHQVIKPLAGSAKLEGDVETSQFSAVVEPYDYKSGALTDTICVIRLSNQRFTFFAGNDTLHDDDTHMQGYDLKAGEHLVITVTLGREGRKVLISAYVEDWTETVTTSVVDDYGMAGDLIQINNRKELREFLQNEKKNKPGNVALIVPNSIDLEVEDDVPTDWEPLPLNCTLNMAGATFRTSHPVFSTVGSSGNLVNGTVTVGDGGITTAVAIVNKGTLDHISVLPRTASGDLSSGYATHGGLVDTNYGVIVDCTSDLPVKGTDASVYVGGIASASVYADDMAPMPVIESCTVNAKVDGVPGSLGGGIVGVAVGRVNYNRFEYGITVLQDATNFKNIVQARAIDPRELRAEGNSWPTIATNAIGALGNDNVAEEIYDATIDSQEELGYLLSLASYNATDKKYRLSSGFSVSKDSWIYGIKSDVSNGTGMAVEFQLNGNGKTITTDAMLFANIRGEVRDLTIRLNGNITPAVVGDEAQDAVAALAYSVTGADAKISNIRVKAGNYTISGPNVGGVVVWAYNGATVEDCQCKATILVDVPAIGQDAKLYAGGIVACAAKATITRCVFHTTDETLYRTPDDSSKQIFYGGILGGTVPNGSGDFNSKRPEVLITDCTSWFDVPKDTEKQKGAIVGYGMYAEDNSSSTHANGIKKGCQGNWWGTTNGIGSYIGGSIEELLGRRNAVTPEHDANYDD